VGGMSVQILQGDCRDVLRTLPAGSVQCVVTSPPYWGLRDYGVAGQLGLEASMAEHIAVIVDVFNEVRRVLRDDGTVWLNYGDCYATTPNGRSAADTKAAGNDDRTFRDKPFSTIGGYLKPKDLCMIPNRVAIALQEAGWWVRSEIIWGKPNPMPESVTDRPATAHEKMFLLSKSARYFYDADAVRMQMAASSGPRLAQDIESQQGSARAHGGYKVMKAVGKRVPQGKALTSPRNDGNTWNENNGRGFIPTQDGRNLRNYEPAPFDVWHIATQPFSEAHFATFPPNLVVPCILAGSPEGGTVLDIFGGSGTVGLVADRLNRNAILIELNPEYIGIARRRIEGDSSLFAEVSVA
jgi:DNA modification methylase